MSLARIIKPETRHSWRLGLFFLILIQAWGFWPLIPLRRIAGHLTGYVYGAALRLSGGVYVSVLVTIFLTLLITFAVCRFYTLKLIASFGGISLLFALDIYRVVTVQSRPDVLWPTLFWAALALVIVILRSSELMRWYSLAVPGAILTFWFYDSVRRLITELELIPALGPLWPNPGMSYTYQLDGFLGLPGSVFVLLPVALLLTVIFTYRES